MSITNIIIVSYNYPPDNTIAARRWAKFAKYLSKNKNFKITVIAAKSHKTNSPWLNDIIGIEVKYINTNYPKILLTKPKTIFQKIKYKLCLLYCKFFSNGTPYDRAIFWKRPLFKMLDDLITINHQTIVIANGPPHRVNYYCTLYKLKKNKNIKVICDFRDPWIWWYNLGYPYLNNRRKKNEKNMQDFVIKHADLTCVPMFEMQKILSDYYPQYKNKITILPHGYDENEIQEFKNNNIISGKFKLVYYGNIYANQKNRYESIAKIILSKQNTFETTLDFYSDSKNYYDLFENHGLINKNVFYYNTLPERLLFEALLSYNMVIIVFPDIFKDYFSTKITEIIRLRIPILLICQHGELSNFIIKNKLGLHFTEDEIETKLKLFLENPDLTFYNSNFDNSIFSFSHITNDLINNIEKLINNAK